jgi:Lamin Tail Domain
VARSTLLSCQGPGTSSSCHPDASTRPRSPGNHGQRRARSPIAAGQASVRNDSPGSDDGSNSSLNKEYFTIKNSSSTTRSLTGYTVRDKANHVYKFGTFSLCAGKSVRVHTGKGTNTSTNRYWGRSWYVWNNTGDKAYLRNPDFVLRDSCEWGDGPGYKWC